MSDTLMLGSQVIGEYGIFSIIGFVLMMDNFRVSIGLGTLDIKRTRQKQIAFAFGLFESIIPILGAMIGNFIAKFLGSWTTHLGPLTIGLYGIYMIYLTTVKEQHYVTSDSRWLLLVLLPLSLSLDNLIAGISMGLMGIQLLTFALIIGITTTLVSLGGMQLGRIITKYVSSNTNMFCGISLIVTAISLVVII
jgi:manganese efflux pump family protein